MGTDSSFSIIERKEFERELSKSIYQIYNGKISKYIKDILKENWECSDIKYFKTYFDYYVHTKIIRLMKSHDFNSIMELFDFEKRLISIPSRGLYKESVIEATIISAYKNGLINDKPLRAYYNLVFSQFTKVTDKNIRLIQKEQSPNTKLYPYTYLKSCGATDFETYSFYLHFIDTWRTKLLIDALNRAYNENWIIDRYFTNYFVKDYGYSKPMAGKYFTFRELDQGNEWYPSIHRYITNLKYKEPIMYWVCDRI